MSESVCRICSKPLEPVVQDEFQHNAVCAGIMNRIANFLCCDECIERIEQDREKVERKQAIQMAIELGVERGDLPADIAKFAFQRSNQEIEGRNAQAWAAARAYKRADGNLWLWGPPGCGKTHIALCIAFKAARLGFQPAHISARRFVVAMQQFDAGRVDLERWQRCALLSVDDLDKMNISENNLSGLWELFDARANRQLPTIITTNLDRPSLRQLWTQRTANETLVSATLDRLKPCTIIEMTGQSNRGEVVRLNPKL